VRRSQISSLIYKFTEPSFSLTLMHAPGHSYLCAVHLKLKRDPIHAFRRSAPSEEPIMSDASAKSEDTSAIPDDDPKRKLTIARPDADASLEHIGLVGDTYTVLLRGEDTAGRYCLIDMHIPPGGGPPPHRHDFEETFVILEGELEATFRGVTQTVRGGETIHIPANAPHMIHNSSDKPVRVLCTCAPAGQATRTTPPPPMDEAAEAAFREKAGALAAKYRTEFVAPTE
jgi:quercetin dioxygenase-like cupin family protein